MPELLTLQDLANGHLDVKALGEAANGDENTIVTTRTGNTYPSAERAINIMFQNGGLPAAPFFTKALMEASALVDGKYAQVTDDKDNNGLYVKTAGVWVKSAYDPVAVAKPALLFDKRDSNKAQSGKAISDYLDGFEYVVNTGAGSQIKLGLNKYTGASDPSLLVGNITNNGSLITTTLTQRTAEFDIPTNATHLLAMNIKTATRFSILGGTGNILMAGVTIGVNALLLPQGAKKLRFTVVFGGGAPDQDFVNDNVVFSQSTYKYGGNEFLRKTDAARNIKKPVVTTSSEFALSVLPDYSTARKLTASDTAKIPEVFNGRVSDGTYPSPSIVDQPLAFFAKIPIPQGAKYFEINIESSHKFGVVSNALGGFLSTGESDEGIHKIPDGGGFLILNVKVGVFEINKLTDTVVFYHDELAYLLSNTTGKALIDEEAVKDTGKIMLARNLYTVQGIDFRLYTESLFSGFAPLINYAVELYGNNLLQRVHYSKVLSAGNITVYAYDLHRRLIDSKTSTIYSKPMPTTLRKAASPTNKLQVLFIGDSLIHNNANGIGKEWLRMINTDEPTETIVGDVVYLPTYNIGKGNIELVGNYGSNDVKYEIGNHLSLLMEGTGAIGDTSANPFYDASSTNPDEIGLDGWHKRVDIAKYLQSVCGQGKYPDYIYIACGVNDIRAFGWGDKYLPLVRNRMRAVLGRIKAACDEIAGGDSDVQILVMNHQFYPVNEGTYRELSTQNQRHLWAKHYTAYEDMIDNDTVNGIRLNTYARFVDCASSFDQDYAYEYTQGRANPRTVNEIKSIVDTVHIGANGSALYADALLRDFLYHECS